MFQLKHRLTRSGWCFIFLLAPVFSARILGIFPLLSKSHYAFNEAIMKSLAKAGHKVTVVAPFSHYSSENFTVVNSNVENRDLGAFMANGELTFLMLLTHLIDALEDDCNKLMSMKEVKALENFDILFVEMLPMCQCFFPLAKRMHTPIIGTSAHQNIIHADYSVGTPRMAAVLAPEAVFVDSKMTFYKRVESFVFEILYKMVFIIEEIRLKKFYETYYPEQGPIPLEISWLFTNNHPLFLPRPVASNAIDIGGIHVKTAESNPTGLPQILNKFIEEASHGVIYFSLGSILNHKAINSKTMRILKSTFAKIPQRIIWKMDELTEKFPGNIYVSKWLPQKEILAHENVLAFISHCGLSSVYEAVYFAKPIIAVPVFGDQLNNAGNLIKHRTSVGLNIKSLTEPVLLKAINDIIHDRRYRQNMELLSRKFKDELNSPAEQVVHWTEYVLKYNDTSDLRSDAVGMPLYQYLLLDVIAFFVACILLTAFIISFCIKYTIGRILRSRFGSSYFETKKLI